MVMLCTLAEAKVQCEVDYNDRDAYITSLIHFASRAVLRYIKVDETDLDSDNTLEVDSDGLIVVADDVKYATLYWIGIMFRDRDGQSPELWEPGFPPGPVRSLLTGLRDPTIA